MVVLLYLKSYLFTYKSKIFFTISVSFNMYFYVLISLLIAVLVLSFLFVTSQA